MRPLHIIWNKKTKQNVLLVQQERVILVRHSICDLPKDLGEACCSWTLSEASVEAWLLGVKAVVNCLKLRNVFVGVSPDWLTFRSKGLSLIGWLIKRIHCSSCWSSGLDLQPVLLTTCCHGYRTINLFVCMWKLNLSRFQFLIYKLHRGFIWILKDNTQRTYTVLAT